MNNRKQRNKRGKNPRQYTEQIVKANPKKDQPKSKVTHLTSNQ